MGASTDSVPGHVRVRLGVRRTVTRLSISCACGYNRSFKLETPRYTELSALSCQYTGDATSTSTSSGLAGLGLAGVVSSGSVGGGGCATTALDGGSSPD